MSLFQFLAHNTSDIFFSLLIANLHVTTQHLQGPMSLPSHRRVPDRSQGGEYILPNRVILSMHEFCDMLSYFYSQAAHSPFTPMRTYTSTQPSTSPERVTRRWYIALPTHLFCNLRIICDIFLLFEANPLFLETGNLS
jgi:hypothetical protein